jgi:uncharacterized SAM-binding protein YcdF (DUF218 family)
LYFALSKTLGLFAVPSNDIAVLALVGLVLLRTRYVRVGRRLLFTSLALVIVVGMPQLGIALTLVLEQRFPPWVESATPPDGVIVLGGVIDAETSAVRRTIVLGEAAERVTEIAALARRYPTARIIFCGGNANLVFPGLPEAAFAEQLFESFDIPRARVLIEDRSRNTAENARFAKALVNPKPGERWLLVTSAMHMPRAVGAFRKAGFPIEPYPVDWRTRGWSDLWLLWLPSVDNLVTTDRAAKEWVGLLVYGLTGRSSELLPGTIGRRPPNAEDERRPQVVRNR